MPMVLELWSLAVPLCPPFASSQPLCNDVTRPHFRRANNIPSIFWQTLGEEDQWHALFFLTLALVC
jgi:hypothetical protein